MFDLRIGDLTISIPIIQGGMGIGISMSRLASAVANEGGVGVISAAGLGLVHRNTALDYISANIEGLRSEIRKARRLTEGVIGVNIMVAMTNFADLVRTAILEKVDIIFSGAGLPLDLPSFIKKGCKTKLVPIVSSARAARLICDKWKSLYDYLPDAVVVEGPKAGGHLGFKRDQIERSEYSLEMLVPEVVKELKVFENKYNKSIPLIAAGGIYSGKDVYDIFKLGAKGVQLGSRFVTTKECDASDIFKQTYIDANENDVKIIQSPVGMPGRALQNTFITEIEGGIKRPVKCPFHCIRSCDVLTAQYCIISALYSAYKGNMKHGFAFAGSNAFKANEITSVKNIFNELTDGYYKAKENDLKK